MTEARFKGFEKFQYIPAGARKDRLQRFADMLVGHLRIVASSDADEWNYVKRFTSGSA